MRLITTILASFLVQVCIAQVIRPMQFVAVQSSAGVGDPYKNSSMSLIDDERVLVIYDSPPSKKGGATSYHAVLHSLEGSILVEGGGAYTPAHGENHEIVSYMVTSNSLVWLHRLVEPKTGLVRYLAERFALETLMQESAPEEIARIPFDPKSFDNNPQAGYLSQARSEDGTKIFMYYDDIMLEGVKLFLCWVFDQEMKPLWMGTYKIPAQAYGFESLSLFSNDGSVFLQCRGVALSEKNIKERSDGSIKLNTVTNITQKKISESIFRLRGEEFVMLPSVPLPDGLEDVSDLLFHVSGSDLHYAALGWNGKGSKRTDLTWLWGSFNADFEPGEWMRTPAAPGTVVDRVIGMTIGDDGQLFIGGDHHPERAALTQKDKDKDVVICAIDSKNQLRWQTFVDWNFVDHSLRRRNWGRSNWSDKAFIRGNNFHLAFANQGSQSGKEMSGKVQYKGSDHYPVLLTLDGSGLLRIENLSDIPGFPAMSYLRDFGLYFAKDTQGKNSGFLYRRIE